jgi:hypothetical protein
MNQFVEYIPIATSILSLFFAIEIFAHWRVRRTTYLLWWTVGVVTFAFGTATESINVLFGWSLVNFKIWYIVGALLGGFPLAQGSVYLLASKKFADVTAWLFVSLILVASVCVVLSPVSLPPNFNGKLSGSVLTWQWVRSFSPFINSYAFIFLVGGAIYSAVKYAFMSNKQARLIGNVIIAIGAILPGIGGTFTRMGYVNVLFVTELVGLTLIYAGYRIIKADRLASESTCVEPMTQLQAEPKAMS